MTDFDPDTARRLLNEATEGPMVGPVANYAVNAYLRNHAGSLIHAWEANQRIRELHRPAASRWSDEAIECNECGHRRAWPCPTLKALEGEQ